MVRRPTHGALTLVVVVVLLLPSAALAADRSPRPPRMGEEISRFLGGVWETAVRLFAPSGSIMDPDGHPKSNSACRGESGSIMDPNGCPHLPTPGAISESGSIMDPDG